MLDDRNNTHSTFSYSPRWWSSLTQHMDRYGCLLRKSYLRFLHNFSMENIFRGLPEVFSGGVVKDVGGI